MKRCIREFRFQLFEAVIIKYRQLVPVIKACALRCLSSKENPSGRTKCSLHPVTAQVLDMFPVFWGISGSTKTILNIVIFYQIFLKFQASICCLNVSETKYVPNGSIYVSQSICYQTKIPHSRNEMRYPRFNLSLIDA